LNGYASHPDVIAVSASTSLNKKAIYSNWGKEISVCAPSNNYHHLVPGSRVKGYKGIWTTDIISASSATRSNGYTKDFGGTSCSAALAAGVAALVLSANRHLSAAQVKQILQETADKIVDNEPDMMWQNRKGVYVNGHSEWFGYGKINAARAVAMAKRINNQLSYNL
jgi:subtilisin family serine protease